MLIYKNTRTGVEISALCPVGGEWKLVTNTDEAVKPEEPKKKATKKTTKKK